MSEVNVTRSRSLFLFLTHDDTHHIEGQMPLLAIFLEPLGLGKRRGSLFAVHRVQQVYLFLLLRKDSS